MLANGDELKLNLPKFVHPLYFCFLIMLFGTFMELIFSEEDTGSQYLSNILVCNFFTSTSFSLQNQMGNLYYGQYRFQPIKFVDLVVPSPYETQPYNIMFTCNEVLMFIMFININVHVTCSLIG